LRIYKIKFQDEVKISHEVLGILIIQKSRRISKIKDHDVF